MFAPNGPSHFMHTILKKANSQQEQQQINNNNNNNTSVLPTREQLANTMTVLNKLMILIMATVILSAASVEGNLVS
jgi:hypothetical protein